MVVLEQQLCIRNYNGVLVVSFAPKGKDLAVHISLQAFLALGGRCCLRRTSNRRSSAVPIHGSEFNRFVSPEQDGLEREL
jgi:hypothetical protein